MTPVEFIDEVLMLWPPYRWDEDREVAWAKTMTLELSPFAGEVLTRAMASLRRKKFQKTPQPADCIGACAEAERWIEMERKSQQLPALREKAKPDSVEDRQAHADMLVKSPMGKQAAKEGWIGALHAFCMRRAPDGTFRLPMGQEIKDCQRQAKEFDTYYDECVREAAKFDAANPPRGKRKQVCHWHVMTGLGTKMLKRREELRDMVLHGVTK